MKRKGLTLPELAPLRIELSRLYRSQSDCERVLDSAGLDHSRITLSGSSANAWHQIIVEANNQNRLVDVVAVAAAEYPSNEIIARVAAELALEIRQRTDAKPITWRGSNNTDSAEKILGAVSSLVPVANLLRGWQVQASVARVKVPEGFGSGFLTESNLFVTNNHVIRSSTEASAAAIEFNYQLDENGNVQQVVQFGLDPENGFLTSADQDWTAVRVQGNANEQFGAIPFSDKPVEVGDRVNIVQHPLGGLKQIALFHNLVEYVDDTVVQYLTDTQEGSSGSPVFDQNWELVALHHWGGLLPEPTTGRKYYRNEGIRTDIILEQIAALF